MIFANNIFSAFFGFRISPSRTKRRCLVNALPWLARFMDQHRAGIDEPLHLEILERFQNPFCAFDIDLVIKRTGFPGPVKISNQMENDGNLATIFRRDFTERELY